MCAALQHEFTIEPGEVRFVVLVGVVYHKEDAVSLRQRYDDGERLSAGWWRCIAIGTAIWAARPPRPQPRSST